jgi:hypothetical protein
MFTTAGVTAFATSANPFAGDAVMVMATGVAVEAGELDACEAVSDWPPQIKTMPRAATMSAVPSDRRIRFVIGSSLMMMAVDDSRCCKALRGTYQAAMRGGLGWY